MAERILVTGGAGYLGSIMVPMLLDRGYEVVVLDNFLYGQNTLLDCCGRDGFQVIRGDCRDPGMVARGLAQADVVVPLAALVGAPACQRDQTAARSINLEAIELLVKMRTPRQRIIYPTTNSGYGIGEPGKFCTEETPLRPISLYGSTKVEAERAVLAAGNSLTFRLATVFGMSPRMRIDLLVNDFVYRAVTDRTVVVFEGHAKRNYLHVRDVARAFLHALDHFDQMQGGPYNVGLSDANLSKLELCVKIQQHVHGFVFMEAPIGEDPDKRDYIVSNAKIESTGFKPAYTIDDGIRELIKGYEILRNGRYSNVG
jgi:nucleoside-diphosphate-sugar epimerase